MVLIFGLYCQLKFKNLNVSIKLSATEVTSGSNSNTERYGGLNKDGPHWLILNAYNECLSHQGVGFFEKIRRMRRCGPVGGSMSLRMGFEVSKAHVRPSANGDSVEKTSTAAFSLQMFMV